MALRELSPLALADELLRPSFEAIYRDHFRHVWHTLRRLGVVERDLEDAAHEVFVVVHRRLEDYDPRRPLKPWVTGIAYRVASDERRRARHRREVFSHEGWDARDKGDGPEEHLAATRARALVQAALSELPLDQRAAVVMHDLDGLSIPDIAHELGIPLNTMYSRLRLGRRKFTAAVRAIQMKTQTRKTSK